MAINDDFMLSMLPKARVYSIVILRRGPNRDMPGADKIVWEHARRNFEMREAGTLAVVCPVSDGSEVNGVGIFTTSIEETTKIMEADPGVQAGVFTFTVHGARGFPGDGLPPASP